jgi:hypothetical protein
MEEQRRLRRPDAQRKAIPIPADKRTGEIPGAGRAERSYSRMAGIPNSSMIGILQGNDAPDPGLSDAMQAKMRRFMERQIPAAEREADALSEGAFGSTAPEIKASLGAQMGADFSDVRFHTGPDAVEKAEAIGARAFTTGRDVYFGEGGFAPDVAAHELVHTAQQGVVESAAATESVAAGTVQMIPKFLSGLKNKWHEYRRNRMIGKINRELQEVVDPRSDVTYYANDPTSGESLASSTGRTADTMQASPAHRRYKININPEIPLESALPDAFVPAKHRSEPSDVPEPTTADLEKLQKMTLVHEKTHAAADMQYASNRSGEKKFQLMPEEKPTLDDEERLYNQHMEEGGELQELLDSDPNISDDVYKLFKSRLTRGWSSPGEWDSVMNELVVGTKEFGMAADSPFAVAVRKKAKEAMSQRRKGRR